MADPAFCREATVYFVSHEVQVADWLLSAPLRGMANQEIAVQLGTASGTIKMHIQNILAKLEATDHTHAVTIALARGLIHL